MPLTLTSGPVAMPWSSQASPALPPRAAGQLLTTLKHQQEQKGSPVGGHADFRGPRRDTQQRVVLGLATKGC